MTDEKNSGADKIVGSSDGLATCEWWYDLGDDVWATHCDNMFSFVVDGPKENGMNFCPYCGKPLVVVANG